MLCFAVAGVVVIVSIGVAVGVTVGILMLVLVLVYQRRYTHISSSSFGVHFYSTVYYTNPASWLPHSYN